MREEVVRILKHFRLSAALNLLKGFIGVCLMMTLATVLVSVSPLENFFFKLICGVTVGLLITGFVFSCKKHFLENSSVQLYNTKKLEKLSVEESFELLLEDKRIHESLLKHLNDKGLYELENSRYASVRFNHFLSWFGKNISSIEVAVAMPEFCGDTRKEFCKTQRENFKTLFELFADDEVMIENIRKSEGYVKGYLPEYEVV